MPLRGCMGFMSFCASEWPVLKTNQNQANAHRVARWAGLLRDHVSMMSFFLSYDRALIEKHGSFSLYLLDGKETNRDTKSVRAVLPLPQPSFTLPQENIIIPSQKIS